MRDRIGDLEAGRNDSTPSFLSRGVLIESRKQSQKSNALFDPIYTRILCQFHIHAGRVFEKNVSFRGTIAATFRRRANRRCPTCRSVFILSMLQSIGKSRSEKARPELRCHANEKQVGVAIFPGRHLTSPGRGSLDSLSPRRGSPDKAQGSSRCRPWFASRRRAGYEVKLFLSPVAAK